MMNLLRHTLLKVLRSGMDELQSDKLEAAKFETLDDVANDSPLDTVGLDGCPQRQAQR